MGSVASMVSAIAPSMSVYGMKRLVAPTRTWSARRVKVK